MSIGRLQVGVFDGSIGIPADSAVVQITPRGTSNQIVGELITDFSGQTETIDLTAPPLEFSMELSEKPYTEYDLHVMSDGYVPRIIEGVQIMPDATAYQDVRITPIAPDSTDTSTTLIKEHTLWGTFPAKIPEDDVKELPRATGLIVLPDPVVPEFIIVHDGLPDNPSAPNYWVPFADYIKNVASSEIYPTWPTSTITANVLAILSFTLNRVYTEWYRNRGYNFTITSSTAYDHAFSYGRNIFSEISGVVDNIFTSFVTRPGIRQPLFTQYCDGKRVSCPNWMSQWGSKSLGDQGHSAIDILRSYYGYDIFLMQAQKVAGVPMSYSGHALQMGSVGEDVRIIQQQLNAVSNNYPAIRKIRVDGIFGQETLDAVETFQRVFRIPADGIVGFSTWYKISDVYTAVSRIAELN